VSNENIKIYPNPVSQTLILETPEDYSIEIYSILGELILSTTQKQIAVQHFTKGVYFVVIKNPSGQTVKSEKIIKQ
jgi:hypothetical protein